MSTQVVKQDGTKTTVAAEVARAINGGYVGDENAIGGGDVILAKLVETLLKNNVISAAEYDHIVDAQTATTGVADE